MRVGWTSVAAVAALVIVSTGLARSADRPAEMPTETPAALALAAESGCHECHGMDRKVIGPPFREIAERYRDDAEARAALIEKVKRGGKGNWTELTRGVPMPPHSPRLTDDEIEMLVDWILSSSEEVVR